MKYLTNTYVLLSLFLYSLPVYGWSRRQFVGRGREEPHCVEIEVKKGKFQLTRRHVVYDVVLTSDGNASKRTGNSYLGR